MTESTMRALLSLNDAVELIKDKYGILGTDLETEISEDVNPTFVNHNSD